MVNDWCMTRVIRGRGWPSARSEPAGLARNHPRALWQFRHQFRPEVCFQWRLLVSEYEYASKGASMRMRLIAVLAVLTASFALGGCFHHNQAVIVEPQPLPPLK